MEIHLPSVPLMKIFSYLDAYSLLQAAQVNKDWNELASSDVLWRRLCQKRWLFCDMVTLQLLGTETWKEFFVSRTWQEHAKSRAIREDFIYKEIPAEYGVRAHPCYISGRGLTRNGQGRPVVCMVTSVNRISTWDIQEGVLTWVSPVQQVGIKLLTTLPEMHIAVTVDIQSTIKLWDCQNSEALATSNLESPCKLLKAVFTKDGPMVLIGDISGNLYIFRIPDLHLISKLKVFQCSINQLNCSPQKKWIFLNRKHPHILPKVFYMSSLLRTSEFSAPVSTILKFSLCQRAFWTPRMEDRITLMSIRRTQKITKFITFDMKLKEIQNKMTVKEQFVASFSVPDDMGRPKWFGVSGKDVIVCSTGSSLLLFNIKGVYLQTIMYYTDWILRLWMDPIYVIVTFNNGSLVVYAWEERCQQLNGCYQLQSRRRLPQQSFINKTLCDDMSIIRVMTTHSIPSFLMAYILTSDL